MIDPPVRTVFLGSGEFGRESLSRLDAHPDISLVGVVTAPPRPAGRGGRRMPTPIHLAADELAVRAVLTPESLRAAASVEEVLALGPELIILADYGRIVPAALLGLRHGALNLHPSLLPRHRGATPIPAAILAGDTETGVTLVRMDEGLDTGPIIAQVRVALDGHETAPALEEGLERMAADLLDVRLGPWLRGERRAIAQSDVGVTMTRPLRREDGHLDVSRSAGDLDRQIRALQPWPGSYVDTATGRLIIWSVVPEQAVDGPAPGTFDASGLGVAAGERLNLTEVQPAGGKRMTWDAFLRGHPGIVGSSIVG